MFNFHKPRTYRSTEGCCICKAKSSSSRFTDSRKYERDTMQCFDLKYPRQGEICNACVLLVKRYKRLPVGSKRNWSHVVDAKAGIGPGCSKIQTKYKSERISSRAALANSAVHSLNISSASSSGLGGGGGGGSVSSASSSINGASYMPEKFTKIYKKTKKIRESTSTSGHSSKRKSSNNGWSQSGLHSLPSTPDPFDSDYEDARISGSLSGNQGGTGTVVQFQTQTRASAYRAQVAAEARKRLVKMGTKRRKLLSPRKNRRTTTHEESVAFFDEEEWQERKSCCGMLYECVALGGALLIDAENYKPCEQHRSKADERQSKLNAATILENRATTIMPLQKAIIQTVPAVVQLQPLPPQPLGSSSSNSSASSLTHNPNGGFKPASSSVAASITPTPALKKHHLFFKRQSECFPQGDMVATTQNATNKDTNTSTSPTTTANVVDIIKTESDFNVPTSQQHFYPQISKSSSNSSNNSTSSLQRHHENTTNSTIPASNSNTAILTNPMTTLSALSISVTSSTVSSSSSSTMPQMPKHSLAKVTTISPTLVSSTTTTNSSTALSLAKSNGFMHKIKTADSGKIVKHSLEKLNTAVRLKTSDIHDMKPIIKTVDKSYIIAKPSTQANVITLNTTNSNNATATQHQSLATYNVAPLQQPTPLTASLSAASPTSSTSSTSSSTKFSDNSSDSGFDENMLDRKSASPLQEDCEKKILTRPGVQTMFLASGVQIQGQPQNLVLTGNEMTAKILQNRKYGPLTTSTITSNSRSNNHHQPTTTAVKIAQISTNHLAASTALSSSSSLAGATSMSLAAQAKMRAIYNNSNTIQHENGITTIVPASSLAASSQTAAMQNIAPSTVTITPAPPMGTTQFNTHNVISRKLSTANIINLQSNTNLSNNSHNNITTNNNHHHHQHHNLNSNNGNNTNIPSSAANQKIILLKTSSNSATITPATNYNNNHLHTTTAVTTLSSGGGGLGITR